jgi:hypothetical protein
MDKIGRILNGSFYLVEIVTTTVTRVVSTQGPSTDYLSDSGQFSIMRPYILYNKIKLARRRGVVRRGYRPPPSL